jgi:hypothetical protein
MAFPTTDKARDIIQDASGQYYIVRESGKVEALGITGAPPKTTTSEQITKLQSTLQITKQIKDLLDKIGLAETPAAAIIRGAELEVAARSKTNPDAAAFKSLVEGTLSFLIKSLGEAGTLSTQDVARARQLIPSFYDTKESAKRKLDELETLINNILTTQYRTTGSNDPLGLFK